MTSLPTNQSVAQGLERIAARLDSEDGLEVIYAKGSRSIAKILENAPDADREDPADLVLFTGLAHSILNQHE
uniref:Uncharacterized protein n=1 Tax=viral metagenome TaxID=1070528 RepID=A0A6H1ZLI4_9ZZZZ